MIISDYFQFLFPWLFVTWLLAAVLFRAAPAYARKTWLKVLVPALAAVIALVPLGDLSPADYLLSLNPNFSMGSLALVVALLWPKLFGKTLLRPRQFSLFCLWNVLVSLVLFSSCLGLLPFDLYVLGYNFSLWFVVMALITLIAVGLGSPLAIIFISYIAAFDLHLLPSPNFFDCITDGFLFLASLAALFLMAGRHLGSRKNTSPSRIKSRGGPCVRPICGRTRVRPYRRF